MPVADAGFVLLVIALPIIGVIGFFVVVLVLFLRLVSKAAQALGGRPLGAHPDTARAPAIGLCADPRCHHLNDRSALYCARCGKPLQPRRHVDAHG